jgi:hypothetical protein
VANEAEAAPIMTLWRMGWNEDRVSCVVYRRPSGLQLHLESTTATILSEPFDLQPRMVARSQALRRSLQRRGWQELAE